VTALRWPAFPISWARFGDAAIIAFLLSQLADGALTYVGVKTYGTWIEVNPLVGSLMVFLGQGAALATAKIVAAFLGIVLHLRQVHGAVAVLTGLYLMMAIVPWTTLLFF
jgi:hypothetical protein